MKKKLLQFGSVLLLILIVLGIVGSHSHAALAADTTTQVQASSGSPSYAGIVSGLFGISSPHDFFALMAAELANWILTGAGTLLTLSGWLLNFSINLTLHIKDFVNSTPAIYTTWKALRDMSGILIIFMLLWAAIQMILGIETGAFRKLIVDVVIVGILINFSFFFASVLIDASNIVSVQLYNAIAPNSTLNTAAATSNLFTAAGKTEIDGGLSDIFANALKIQAVYSNSLSKGQNTAATAATGTTANTNVTPITIIIISGIVGTIIEVAAALSFTAASIAFIFRFVMLLVLLAFSPIYFATKIIPETKKYATDWEDQFKAMLIFMPVYLLLMYLALNIIVTNPLFGQLNTSFSGTGTASWYSNLLVLGVNAFLVCIMLNLPLLAAIKLGGKATDFKIMKSIGMDAVWKKFGSNVGSRTVGRAAYELNNSGAVKRLASISPSLGGAVVGGLTKVTKTSFGEKKGSYEDRLSSKKKAEEGLNKHLGNIDKTKYSKEKNVRSIDESGNAVMKSSLDIANEKAKEYQESYRNNLEWKPKITNLGMGGVIGFVLDNTANRQTSDKLRGEAEKSTKKEAKKKAEPIKKANNATIDANEARIKRLRDPKNDEFSPAGEKEAQVLEAENARLKEVNKKLDADIEAGNAIEEEEKWDKLAGNIAEKSKKEGGDGGGGGGDKEKPKEGK